MRRTSRYYAAELGLGPFAGGRAVMCIISSGAHMMLQDPAITGGLVVRVLIEGAILALVLIVLTHLLRTHARPILFTALVIASLAYVLFALRAEAGAGLLGVELIGVLIYGSVGWIGVRGSLWWLAIGWALHPIWDVGLHYWGPGASLVHPLRYPIPCVSFDLVVAGYVAYLAWRESRAAPAHAFRSRAL